MPSPAAPPFTLAGCLPLLERAGLCAALSAACGLALASGPAADQAAGPRPAADPAHPARDLVELPLEALLDVRVSTASRFEQSARDAPSTVHVLTGEDIRAFGWRTLGQALGSLPGVFSSSDRSYTFTGSRGFLRPGDYGSRLLVLVDGQRINEPIYEQAATGREFPLDLALVERIEYVAGPGSAVFGSNAFFGVVNVVTRRGGDHPGAVASLEAASGGHREASARYGFGRNGGELLVAASAVERDGEDMYFEGFDTPDDNLGVAAGMDHERTRKLFVKAGQGGLAASLVHASREKGSPAAPYMQLFNDPRSRDRDQWTLLGLRHRASPTPTLDTEVSAQLGDYTYRGDYAYDAPPAGPNRDVARARWLDLGAHAVTTAIAGHKLLAGIDARWSIRRDQYNFDVAPRHDYLADRRDGHRVGVMVEDEITLRRDLLLNAGLRYDHDSVSGGNFSPRVALVRHWPGERTLKVIHGQAYRSPNAYEMYYHVGDGTDSASQLANPDLSAERIRANELAWSQRLGPRTTWQAAAYRYSVSGLITQVPAGADTLREGALVFLNEGHARATGFELALQHGWKGGAVLRASYGHVAVDGGDSGVPVSAPRHMATLDLRMPMADGRWLAGMEARHIGMRHGEFGPVDACSLANLTLTWRPVRGAVELQGGVRNLADATCADPAGPAFTQNAIQREGRTAFLRATFGF